MEKRGSGLRICNNFLPLCSNTVGSRTKSSLAWLWAESLDQALLKYLLQVTPEGVVMHMYSKGCLSSRLCIWIFVSCLRGWDGISSRQFVFSKHASSLQMWSANIPLYMTSGKKKKKQHSWCLVRFHNIAWPFTTRTLFRFLRLYEKPFIHQGTSKLLN